jgi:hypothetical protein
MILNDRSLPEGFSEQVHIIQISPRVCTSVLAMFLALIEWTWYTAWWMGIRLLPRDCTGG